MKNNNEILGLQLTPYGISKHNKEWVKGYKYALNKVWITLKGIEKFNNNEKKCLNCGNEMPKKCKCRLFTEKSPEQNSFSVCVINNRKYWFPKKNSGGKK